MPAELGSLPSLRILDLRGNGLSREVPESLGSLSSLTRLVLRDNRLSGSDSGQPGQPRWSHVAGSQPEPAF